MTTNFSAPLSGHNPSSPTVPRDALEQGPKPEQWGHPPFLKTERLVPLAEAAEAVGAKYWQVQRAVKRGAIPSYTPFNSRRLVKLAEVLAYIDSCRQGGDHG